jgi:hypothetical protein
MTSRFLDATAILLCASLEALAGDDEARVVSRRLIARYFSGDEAGGREILERLYLLRHWFAHSITIPAMRDSETRIRTTQEGITLVKEILISALADTAFFEASARGIREARAYLDS